MQGRFLMNARHSILKRLKKFALTAQSRKAMELNGEGLPLTHLYLAGLPTHTDFSGTH